MARSGLNYLRLLQSLLPIGLAWTRNEDSFLTQFLYALGDEFTRVDNRSDDLLEERNTTLTYELLEDYENDLGLPDECAPDSQTIAERRNVVHIKHTGFGRLNKQYYIDLADNLGWTITINEYSPAWSGVFVSGEPCGPQENIFYWQVVFDYTGSEDIEYLTCGDGECGDFLSFIGDVDDIICIIEKYRPAHTSVWFDWNGPEFDRAFSSAFDSIPSQLESDLYGAFGKEFGLGFDRYSGGGFDSDAFDSSFDKPS